MQIKKLIRALIIIILLFFIINYFLSNDSFTLLDYKIF